MVSNPLMHETVWLEKSRVEAAERAYYEHQANKTAGASAAASVPPAETKEQNQNKGSSLAGEIARAREQIQKSLTSDSAAVLGVDSVVTSRLDALALENKSLRQVTSDLQAIVKKLEERIKNLELGSQSAPAPVTQTKPEPAKPAAADEDEDDDDDFDPFADEEEDDEEAERLKEARIQEYQAKKSKKPALIAKSNLVLDVKPWEDTTNMEEMEKLVRSIEMDGLVWGASKLAPVGYGIRKLVITCVIEDDKVMTDDLEERITAFEDHVQSMDIAAFNKV